MMIAPDATHGQGAKTGWRQIYHSQLNLDHPTVPKALDKDHVLWHSWVSIAGESRGVVMQKSLLAVSAAAVLAMLLSTAPASSEPYAFGDPPYTLNWWYYPQIQTGCWKWNWQQYLWNDYCPVYVHPKAYMYPHSSRAVLRTRG
jgi:hypothetical protein